MTGRVGTTVWVAAGVAFAACPVVRPAGDATTFVAGLLALAVAVLAAVAIRRDGRLPAWTGAPLAAGFVLYLPQFFVPAELRVAHGLLVAAGCLAVGWALQVTAPDRVAVSAR